MLHHSHGEWISQSVWPRIDENELRSAMRVGKKQVLPLPDVPISPAITGNEGYRDDLVAHPDIL